MPEELRKGSIKASRVSKKITKPAMNQENDKKIQLLQEKFEECGNNIKFM